MISRPPAPVPVPAPSDLPIVGAGGVVHGGDHDRPLNRLVTILLLAAALGLLVFGLLHLPGFVFHPLGLCAGNAHQQMLCRGYNLWSGIASDLSEITLLGLLIGAWRHVNCQAPWCPLPGRHPTADGQHKLCRRHHPDLPDHRLSLREIHLRHHRAKAAALGPGPSPPSSTPPGRPGA